MIVRVMVKLHDVDTINSGRTCLTFSQVLFRTLASKEVGYGAREGSDALDEHRLRTVPRC